MATTVKELKNLKKDTGDIQLKETLLNKNFENGKPYCSGQLDEFFKEVHDEALNIDYHGWQKWVQSRNPEPEKLHNKFADAEKNGIFYSGVIDVD